MHKTHKVSASVTTRLMLAKGSYMDQPKINGMGKCALPRMQQKSASRSVVSDSLRLYSPWNAPGQITGVGSHSLLQGIFPTQESNPGLPHCRWIHMFLFCIRSTAVHIYSWICGWMCIISFIKRLSYFLFKYCQCPIPSLNLFDIPIISDLLTRSYIYFLLFLYFSSSSSL